MLVRGSAGGKARAITQRQEAEKRYYANPNICKACNKVIELGKRKVRETRKKKFCNSSCAGRVNGKIGGKVHADKTRKSKPPPNTTRRHFAKKNIEPFGLLTKGEIYSKYKTWLAGKHAMGDHAQQIIARYVASKHCVVCGYQKHVDVCHIKSLKSFPETATINEINHPDNLVYLCKTHHWEFDHNLMDKEDLGKIVVETT